jgi:hypothetical protein
MAPLVTWDSYKNENMNQFGSALNKSIEQITANDIYIVVGVFEQYMIEKNPEYK